MDDVLKKKYFINGFYNPFCNSSVVSSVHCVNKVKNRFAYCSYKNFELTCSVVVQDKRLKKKENVFCKRFLGGTPGPACTPAPALCDSGGILPPSPRHLHHTLPYLEKVRQITPNYAELRRITPNYAELRHITPHYAALRYFTLQYAALCHITQQIIFLKLYRQLKVVLLVG
jgi:hypothetical protein